MRTILGIDTASGDGSVALARDGVSLASEPLYPGEHSSGLSRASERLLLANRLTLGDIAAVAVSRGPGSFTGLRIGLAWSKGVCFGRSMPLVLVSAHEAAAHAHRAGGSVIATMIPGGRGWVDAALWRGGERAVLLWGPEPIEEVDAVEQITEAARRMGLGPPKSLAPSTAKLAALVDDQIDDGAIELIPPAGLGSAVAEIGEFRIVAGEHVDLVTASPAYGRAPNARRPVP